LLKLFSTIDDVLNALIRVLVLAIVGAGSWLGYEAYTSNHHAGDLEKALAGKDSEIGALQQKLTQLDRDNERLQTANRLLKVDHRVARIDVLQQAGTAADHNLKTTFSFVEVNDDKRPIAAPHTFTIDGDVVFVDAWVIKYDDKLIETADPLRSTSVCLFRRIFGELQRPIDGFSIDAENVAPEAYRSSPSVAGHVPGAEEREIWSNFWKYANDPALSQRAGIRALDGSAQSMRLLPGKHYRLTLRATGDMSFAPDDTPAKDVG
jgi:hypothetical protein